VLAPLEEVESFQKQRETQGDMEQEGKQGKLEGEETPFNSTNPDTSCPAERSTSSD